MTKPKNGGPLIIGWMVAITLACWLTFLVATAVKETTGRPNVEYDGMVKR